MCVVNFRFLKKEQNPPAYNLADCVIIPMRFSVTTFFLLSPFFLHSTVFKPFFFSTSIWCGKQGENMQGRQQVAEKNVATAQAVKTQRVGR